MPLDPDPAVGSRGEANASWWRAASPVRFSRTSTFTVPGIGRTAVERTLLDLGAKPDEHWNYRLVNTQLGTVNLGGSGRQFMATATVTLRGSRGDVGVTAVYRELGIQAASVLFYPAVVAGLLGFVSGLGFARDGAASWTGWLLAAAALGFLSSALWLGRYRETALVVTANTMDAFLRARLGGPPVEAETPPRAPASSRTSKRWQAVALICTILSVGLGIGKILATATPHPRTPAYDGVVWNHVSIENQLKIFDGAGIDVVCNGGHDIRVAGSGQHIVCHDRERGDYTLVVIDPEKQDYTTYGGLLPSTSP